MLHTTAGTSDTLETRPRIIIFNFQDVWPDQQYKVNIYALVQESPSGVMVESKELHGKIVLMDGAICVYSGELERLESISSRGSNN